MHNRIQAFRTGFILRKFVHVNANSICLLDYKLIVNAISDVSRKDHKEFVISKSYGKVTSDPKKYFFPQPTLKHVLKTRSYSTISLVQFEFFLNEVSVHSDYH
ncbi:hypothetical protein HHI36_004182 [Cryptolaemus montrouzieri]|uniref:Uncharacterized protein n=1 Tax=Cryptolaemus montrouzieri TaxID=559131 RepID=A0ABD2NQF3_9CUCU